MADKASIIVARKSAGLIDIEVVVFTIAERITVCMVGGLDLRPPSSVGMRSFGTTSNRHMWTSSIERISSVAFEARAADLGQIRSGSFACTSLHGGNCSYLIMPSLSWH